MSKFTIKKLLNELQDEYFRVYDTAVRGINAMEHMDEQNFELTHNQYFEEVERWIKAARRFEEAAGLDPLGSQSWSRLIRIKTIHLRAPTVGS